MRCRSVGAAVPIVLACTLAAPLQAQAIPAFSRQIHAGCYTCHFQSMGALNAFGRAFEMNNFRLTKKMRQELLERENREGKKRQKEPEKQDR